MTDVASTGSSEWRRLLLTCAVLLPLLTVLHHFLLGYSWLQAFIGAVAYTIGVAAGWWLFRIRPRNAVPR